MSDPEPTPAPRPSLTAQDAARIYGVPVARIHRLAHQHSWRRIRYGGQLHYHGDDVDAVLGSD